MNLLYGTCYDPTTAVTAFTTATTGVAIVAFSTTNLRATFTVPPSGNVRVRMSAQLHGATTFPTILFAVMSGAGIVKRQCPMQSLGNTAVATAQVKVESDFIVNGLTAGEARTWDAGYGVEVGIASTGVKYGGPNNTTANDAFGGFSFEVWDPCPFYTPGASGVPPTSPNIAYTSGIKAQTDLIPASPASTTNITTVGAVSGLTAANLDAAITTRMATYTQPSGFLTAAFPGIVASSTNITVVGAVSGLTAANLDATVSSRLATAGYTAPDNAGIAAAVTGTTTILVDTAAIKAKTDSLSFTVAGKVDSNAKTMNDVGIVGTGISGDLWRGA